MIPTFALVERQVRLRADTDRQMSYGMFWLWSIILSVFGIFTLGLGLLIYQIVIGFQLLNRRNSHFARQHRLFRQLLDGLREEHGESEVVATHLNTVEDSLRAMEMNERRKEPFLWVLLLPVLTLG